MSITSTRELNEAHYSHLSSEEKIESLLKETLRPASTLLTHVQICIVFWILGEYPFLSPSQTYLHTCRSAKAAKTSVLKYSVYHLSSVFVLV